MSDWLRRVENVCAQPLSSKALREQVLALIPIRFDAHVFALVDPVTHVGTSPHADVPMLPWPRLPELIRRRYASGRSVGPTAVSGVWDPMLAEVGMADTAAVGFADRYGEWGFLELWRATPFSDAELGVLTSLAPAVTAGLRASVARTFVDPAEQLLPVGPAVVILGPDLQVRTRTEAAAETLLRLLPPDEPTQPVPAAAYNVAAALLAGREASARIHLGGSRWVTVKASSLGDDIAVSIEPSTPAERTDLFARASGLSVRQSEVLDLLAAGFDTKEIAEVLVLSDHTVNDHVKAILAKTGARTRGALMSRALGAG